MDYKRKMVKIAQEVGGVLERLDNVKAVGVGGGIVSGYPDKFSDIDIYCLCDDFPSVDERQVILETLGLDRMKEQYNDLEFKIGQDLFYYKDWAVGIDYILLSEVEKYFSRIKELGYIAPHDSHMVNRFFYNIVISDKDGLFVKYGKFVKKYLEGFRTLGRYYWKELKKVGKEDDWAGGGRIDVALKRKNYIWLGFMINMYLSWYLICLYALNDTYYHNFLTKWSFKRIKDFQYKPDRCVERLEEISILGNGSQDFEKKLRIFEGLIKDSDELMERL